MCNLQQHPLLGVDIQHLLCAHVERLVIELVNGIHVSTSPGDQLSDCALVVILVEITVPSTARSVHNAILAIQQVVEELGWAVRGSSKSDSEQCVNCKCDECGVNECMCDVCVFMCNVFLCVHVCFGKYKG